MHGLRGTIMVEVEFRDDCIVFIRFQGTVSLDDVDMAWSTMGDERFSDQHDVIADCRGARAGFSMAALPDIISRRDRSRASARGVTCFVVDSHFTRAVVNMVRLLLERDARWRPVASLQEAEEMIRARRAGDNSTRS